MFQIHDSPFLGILTHPLLDENIVFKVPDVIGSHPFQFPMSHPARIIKIKMKNIVKYCKILKNIEKYWNIIIRVLLAELGLGLCRVFLGNVQGGVRVRFGIQLKKIVVLTHILIIK